MADSDEGKGKGRASPVISDADESKGKGKGHLVGSKRRRDDHDDGDKACQNHDDVTAQMLVQRVSCNTLAYGTILIGQFPLGVGTSCES